MGGIILEQPAADIARSHANNGIGGGFVIDGPSKEPRAEESLRQALMIPCESTVNNQLKEILTPFTPREAIASQDRAELVPDKRGLLLREVQTLGLGRRGNHLRSNLKKGKSTMVVTWS
ncbi:MAG TPA: hypothetical protein VH350_08685 [Candidatus Sulfotelmatobacter sp.]|nr:hypothetical protein [Candidatus Sulfotelmatobacter sp.]